MALLIDIASWVCLMGGVFFFLVGSLGVLRLPEFWLRLHASSICDSGGMILIILGLCLQAGFSLVTIKLIVIGIFLFITGPTATHAVANAALVTGWRPRQAKDLPEPEDAPYRDGAGRKVR